MTPTPAPSPSPSPRPTVWPAFQARDPDLLVRLLVALGFEETATYRDEEGRVEHAQLDWPEGGGVMLGRHKPEGLFTQQPGTTAAYVVTSDVEGVHSRAVAAGLDAGPVEEKPYGGSDFRLTDPEGNQWSFGSYPGEPRRDSGSTGT
ncbi:VOC family protein [Nocardioides solisilvae]|uniref:VOC family protein n=1 Tax=Nocardioides solisilvae TaxID=1542435 RepID=UPI000D7411CB|nr:VOC family protein [Nocardioides solisilvae]